MDRSSNNIISSEFGVDSEPQPADNVTYMDVALYMAAAGGKIEEFNNYQGSELELLRTPNHNTVLHVYVATHVIFSVRSCLRFVLGCLDCTSGTIFSIVPVVKQVQNGNWTFKIRSNFIEQILNMCPSLRLQANAKGQTPLHIAARHGHSDIVKFLIMFHAKAALGDLEKQETESEAVREMLRKTDLESNTALHIAAQYGHVRVVQELLEFEDPDFPYSVNRKQETPLYIAARRGDRPLLTMILNKLKSTAHGGPHGRTALHAAAMAGDAGATRVILKNKGNLTMQTDENGQTPLHYAAHLGHYSVVKELLKWDKSAAYIADKKSEMTALLMAARQGHGRIIREIISICPACCEKVDKRGWNLLHFVAVTDSPLELRYLCFQGGDGKTLYGSVRNLIDAKDCRGITPQQVNDALIIFPRPLVSSEKKEQIVKLVEDIVNEEVAETPVRPIPMPKVSEDSIEKAREAHLVVATLIATVTFAAAITVPGGYKSTENGSDQGTPFLIRDAAFKAFVISDALAFIFSLAAVAIHFQMTPPFISNRHDKISLGLAAGYIVYAVWAIVIAFSTGTYAVLKPSPGLAIASCCIGLGFFYFMFAKEILMKMNKLSLYIEKIVLN